MPILFGDEEGIPALIKVCSELKLKIDAIVFSKRVYEKLDERTLREKFLIDQNVFILPPNDDLIQSFVKVNQINFGIIFSYDTILSKELAENDAISIINIHGGELPKYRGANVLNWALINGESYLGVTIHEIDRNVDSGPILFEWRITIAEKETALTLREKLIKEVESKLITFLPLYLNGRIEPVLQEYRQELVFRRRGPDDGFFDWSWSDQSIYNLIRALVYPWPGAKFRNKFGEIVTIQSYLQIDEIAKLRQEENE